MSSSLLGSGDSTPIDILITYNINITVIMTNFAGDVATLTKIRKIVGFENTTDVTLIKFFPNGMNFFLKNGDIRFVAYSELA